MSHMSARGEIEKPVLPSQNSYNATGQINTQTIPSPAILFRVKTMLGAKSNQSRFPALKRFGAVLLGNALIIGTGSLECLQHASTGKLLASAQIE